VRYGYLIIFHQIVKPFNFIMNLTTENGYMQVDPEVPKNEAGIIVITHKWITCKVLDGEYKGKMVLTVPGALIKVGGKTCVHIDQVEGITEPEAKIK
jgi:hypothetical protein